ncbi:PREDICTED: uncharacterized protein LOC109477226 [Branchiostoma belcheri]|uniref:Uncharacterized protein LOC109477226 n=1 Tax=Branchiostoma belcheri TaxID=7741 RepID=A0A6P4ZB57_BRABE|nr:PREDICTED: uncharacterized protein LOC109477226 [Branchiostoma belcheri]
METAKTKLSAVAEELSELDKRFKDPGSDLAVVERGYARKLVHAISSENKVLECEALKSLGDLFLHKAKMKKHKKENFNKACVLYTELSRYYTSEEEKQVIQRRVRYAEKCTKLVHNETYAHTKAEGSANITLAVAATLQEVRVKVKAKEQATLTEGYTRAYVKAIVERNKRLQVESLKSLGDLYLEKGRTGKDEAVFTRAAGLYRAALDRCEDSDGRETLEHRIKYAERVKEKQLKHARLRTKRKAGDGSGSKSSQASRQAVRDVISQGTYRDHLQEGCKAMQTGDLNTAERHFATALKSVHVKGADADTGQQNAKEAEPLYKLSDVYLKRGIQSKDGGDFTKAAALWNAALVRTSKVDRNKKQANVEITKSFMKRVLHSNQTVDKGESEKHKLLLKKTRHHVQTEMKRIEQEVDPYSLDEDDPRLREVEKRRAEEIRKLFHTIVHQRRMFISGLVDGCMEVMGPPPCKYAMMGLGSLATGLVTPYSDLEFAILIEEETESNVEYFRNLTHYLHLKVINLGETILPAMAIKSLNDFQSKDPTNNWFYDSVTPRGFAFDGAMPHACKTPFGRGKQSGLIQTPSNMAKLLTDDLTLYLKKGYHLASILGNVCLITGEQDLVDVYTTLLSQQRQDTDGLISMLVAHITLNENAAMFKLQPLDTRLLDVKKQMYRFATLAVSCWALHRNIQPTTIWETIEKMHKNGVISSENAHHLMVLVSISAELRLRTYMNNRGQVENLSVLSSTSANAEIGEQLKKVFHFSNAKQLLRYYYTERPLKVFVSQLVNSLSSEPLALFSKSPIIQAEVYTNLCAFEKAKNCLNEALENVQSERGEGNAHPKTAIMILNMLGGVCDSLGDYREAVSYHGQVLQMLRRIHGEDTAHRDIATALGSLGDTWRKLADYRKAMDYFEQSLQMRRSIYGDTAHPDISESLSSLGNTLMSLGEYKKAVNYHEKARQMNQSIYGEDTAHHRIAITLDALAFACWNLGNHRKATSYHEQSLRIKQSIYGKDTAHLDIAGTLNNMAVVWRDVGDYKRAESCFEQSLRIQQIVYGERTAHPSIAGVLCNLGSVQRRLCDNTKAISYLDQALQMQRRIHGEKTAHPDIATSLANLGGVWSDLGDYRKSIEYREQALQMDQSTYGRDTPHPDIATSLGALGNAWGELGNHERAINYLEQSLQMKLKTYGENTPHPDIADTLDSLGVEWSDCGDHRKALSYHEQSLQMKRDIYGKPHTDIAASLNNLGNAWSDLGDHKMAVDFYEQSLEMRRSIFGKDTAHCDTANSLKNLGIELMDMGDPRNALSLLQQSLEMEQSIYGKDAAHPDIAKTLDGLGAVWNNLGDHRKAVSYHEQSLQMRWDVYGKCNAHPDLAASFRNLCVTWRDIGDLGKAMMYFEQAREMQRSVFGKNTAHHHVADTLNDLGAAWRDLIG